MGPFALVLTAVLLRSVLVMEAASVETDTIFDLLAHGPKNSFKYAVPNAEDEELVQPLTSGTTVNAGGPPCTTDDGKNGVCVPNFQCSLDTNTLIDSTFISLRMRNCLNYLDICCLSEEFVAKEEPLTCGISNPGGNQLRDGNGGKNAVADYGEFPWMVALLKSTAPDEEWSQTDYIGGGSIIHPSVVITVAHKVESFVAGEVKCRAGEWDTGNEFELYPTQERQVKNIVIHDDFFEATGYYDVALLFLKEPFTFQKAPHIGVGCLDQKLPEPGTQCYTMGWGRDLKGSYASVLKKIKVPLIDSDKCQRKLRNTRLGSRFLLHPSLLCAGGEAGVDACKGDGGSPLVCSIEDSTKRTRYAIYAMSALGVGCGRNGVPGVYVNVPYIYDWVVEKMNEERLNTTTFTI